MSEAIKLDLRGLFESQEKAAVLNLQGSSFLQQAVPFLAGNLDLNLGFLQAMPFSDPEKKTAIRILAVDTLAHVVVAARLGLWGAIPQSVAIIRGALEGATVLASVVFHQKYKTAVYETNRKLSEIEFHSAAASLGALGKDIEKLWRSMSDFGSHASSRRLRHSEYDYAGEKYDRIGCALDAEGAGMAVYHAMHPCMLVTECFHKATEQESLIFPEEGTYRGFVERFNEICNSFRVSVQMYQPKGENGDC